MAVSGTVLAESARANAMALVKRLAGNGGAAAAADRAAVANAHLITPTLVPSTTAQIADMNGFLRHAVVWENDMNCFARASVGARHVNEVLGHGLTPADDAFNAGMAILEAPPGRGWSFHAGIPMKDERGQVWVIHHLTDSKPTRLEAWREAYGVAEDKTYLLSPFGGTKVKGHMTDEGTWSWVGSALNKTWREADQWGVDVRGGR